MVILDLLVLGCCEFLPITYMELIIMKNITLVVFAALLSLSSASYAANAVATDQPATAPAKTAVQHETVNINTADVQTLTNLKGVGQKKAEAIIAWRKTNGNFKTIEQLADVKGVGPAILEANRKMIRVE